MPLRDAFLVARFADARALVGAVRAARAEGLPVYDAYAPCPVHGLDEALGVRRTRLPLVTLAAGLCGLAFALCFQLYTNVIDWPLDVGGKPANSTLAFVPICFELTVLIGGLATVGAFFLRSRLYPGKRGELVTSGVTNDVFALAVPRPDDASALQLARALLVANGAETIEERRAELVREAANVATLALVAGALVLGLSACGARGNVRAREYMPDMARSPAYKAFEPNPATRDGLTLQRPVAGTIARGHRPFPYGAGEEAAARAGEELVNPFAPTPAVLADGRALYETTCIVCHGARGRGDGPIASKIPPPAAYTSERVMAFAPGRLFHVITRGSGKMPPHAAQLAPDERWKIVAYVGAVLQGKGPGTRE